MSSTHTTMLIVMMIAFAAPLLVEMVPKVAFPSVVVMILLGIIVGPQGLGWAETYSGLDTLARLGLSFLFFLAGLEVNYKTIRGRPLTWAMQGWLISLVLAFTITGLLKIAGLVNRVELVAAALATGSLGSLLPILKEADLLRTRLGVFTVAAGTLGELAPLLLITLVLSPAGGQDAFIRPLGDLLGYLAVLVLGGYVAIKVRPPRLIRSLKDSVNGGSQLPVRLSLLVLTALTLLTNEMGMESVLGALCAGILVGLTLKGGAGEAVRANLEAIGYGLLIPIFYIHAGLTFNLDALIHSKVALAKVPLFLILFFVIRGIPVLFCRKDLPKADWMPLALMSSATLALVVAISHLGLATHRMSEDTAVALVSAAMLGKLLFPTLAITLRRYPRLSGPRRPHE